MQRFKEAKEIFRKRPDSDSALQYHRSAWEAYLHDDLDDACMYTAMRELQQFWDAAP
jgi:hypothetical protein